MIPVPLVLGVLGLLLLAWAFMQQQIGADEDAGWPNGVEPTGDCRKVFIHMHILARTRYAGRSYAWNVTRTATAMGISEDQVRACYPLNYWNAVHEAAESRILANGEAEFGVSPAVLVQMASSLEEAGHNLDALTNSQLAGLMATTLYNASGGKVSIPAIGGTWERWTTYVSTALEG